MLQNSKKILSNEDIISNISRLDITDDDVDEKYKEFKDAINNGTFNDEYNLTEKDLEKIRSDEVMTQLPNLLDMMFVNDNLIQAENIDIDITDYFHKLYENYLGRPLVKAEKDTISHAIRIMLWKVSGRTFKTICQHRYAYVARVFERRRSPDISYTLKTKYLVGYHDIPDKKLKAYPLFRKDTLARDVDYDRVIFDTYDFLDKLIGFKLSDLYFAIFNEYYLFSKDERALRLAKYMKYGTDNEREIMFLRYGFDFEDIEWISPCVSQINESEIVFNKNVYALSKEQLAFIEKYINA